MGAQVVHQFGLSACRVGLDLVADRPEDEGDAGPGLLASAQNDEQEDDADQRREEGSYGAQPASQSAAGATIGGSARDHLGQTR